MKFTLNVQQTKDFLFKPTVMEVEARKVTEPAMAVDENGNWVYDETGNAVLEIKKDADGNPILDESGNPQLSGRTEDVAYASIKLIQQVNPFKKITEESSMRFQAAVMDLVTGFEVDGKTPVYNQAGMTQLLSLFNLQPA